MTAGIREGAAPHAAFDRQYEESLLRRQRNGITATLIKIHADLRLDLLQAKRERGEAIDDKTLMIMEWHRQFSNAIAMSERPQRTYEEFKERLREILVDSIFGSAIDENCLLGSDGGTYTEIALAVFRSLAPAHFQNRSPLRPNLAEPLTTVPHVCARYMIAWLNGYSARYRNDQNAILEDVFRQLNGAERRNRPAAAQDEVTRRIMARQVERQRERERERNAHIEERRAEFEEYSRASILPFVRQRFNELDQRIAQVADRQLSQAEDLNERVGAEFDELQSAIEQLQAEIEELSEQEKELEERNKHIQTEIKELRQKNSELSSESAALKKQIKERKKAELKMLGKALLTIGACALGTVAARCAMAGMSGSAPSMAVKPVSNGCMVQSSIRF